MNAELFLVASFGCGGAELFNASSVRGELENGGCVGTVNNGSVS